MSRHEKTRLSAEMRRELQAIDATLADEAVGAADAQLAELTRTLRSLRPQPGEQFVRALDAKAARGFRRERQAPARESARRRRTLMLIPAVGVVVAIVAVMVAISSSRSGHGPLAEPLSGSRAGGASVISPAVSQPAQPTSRPSATRAGEAGAATRSEASPGSAAAGPAARQVERTSALDVGVAPGSVQSASQRVFTVVSDFGGYVRQSNVSSGAEGGASFDIRVPTANLAPAIAALSHLGHVRSENDTTNDVTDQLGSLQRTLGDLRAQRSSLLRQLARATEGQRAEQLRRQLQAVEQRITQTQGSIRALRARVDYTRLALSLTPESSGGAATGDLTPGGAAHNAAKILDAALAVLLIGAAAILPLAVVVTAGWIVVAMARRRLREQALDTS